ncbi:MAG: hypothetical protein NTX45_02440 [Proteobacteria bacterium]|nr:hypothetical protein [Pseudomonadota bacterium]
MAVWLDGDRSHGQAGTPIKPDGKAGIGQGFGLPAHRHQARRGRPAQAFTVWQGKPIAVSTTGKAPRSGDNLPTVKATGLARGTLPLGDLLGWMMI